MDPLLLGTASAFGLAASAGLNTSLPLFIVGLAARFGLLTLASPYDALASDIALIGLGVLAVVEFTADKIPGLDSVIQVLQGPVTLAAGAILFASQQSIVHDVSPGLALLVGLLTAGGIHGLRAVARPIVNVGTLGIGGPVASTVEDVGAVALAVLAILAPLAAIAGAIAIVALVIFLALRLAARRRRLPRTALTS
jgi:uncharacterized protein DUF4126